MDRKKHVISKFKRSTYKEQRFVLIVRLTLGRYLYEKEPMTVKQFERYLLNKSKTLDFAGVNLDRVLKHYRNQVYPLDKRTVAWMAENLKDEIHFVGRFEEIKTLVFSYEDL